MLPCVKLLEYIVENQLDSVYEQTLNLLKLVLSIPVTSASTERSMSTLKRIKTYLRNAMKNKRLSQLGTSSIEKELTFMCTKDPTFKERLIDIFANFKTCGTHLQENMNDCVMPTVIQICHHSKNEAITDVPVVLVGNKTDQWGDRMVSLEDGQRRSKEIGCVCFHEISVRESIEQVWAVFRDVCLFWKVHSKFHKLKRSPSDIHITENSQHVVNVNPNVCNGKPTLSSMLARRWTEVEFDEEDENSSGSSKSSFGKNSDHLPPFRSRASTDGHLLSRPRRLRYPPPTPITSTHQSDRRMSISMRGNNNSY